MNWHTFPGPDGATIYTAWDAQRDSFVAYAARAANDDPTWFVGSDPWTYPTLSHLKGALFIHGVTLPLDVRDLLLADYDVSHPTYV